MRLPTERVAKPRHVRVRCVACREPFRVEITPDGKARPLGEDDSGVTMDSVSPEIAAALGMTGAPTTRRPPMPKPRPLAPHRKVTAPPSTLASDETLSGTIEVKAIADDSMAGVTVEPASTMAATGMTGNKPASRAPSAAMKHGGGLAPTLPSPAQVAGDRLGVYELKKKIGEGGMGAVYLARQTTLDRDVAVKVLSPRLSNAPALIGRFMREAYAAGQLVHHNVVQIYDFGRETVSGRGKAADVAGGAGGEAHYFSMEFVDGGSLQGKLKSLPDGRMESKEAVSLALQAARGLAFAHEHGLIHRDVKPDNLMLNKLGILKVADLGLVKQIGVKELDAPGPMDSRNNTTVDPQNLNASITGSISSAASAEITQLNAMMGTPAYLPPEQAADAKNTDGRADIYSLGATLYHLVVGKPPFSGRTLQEVLDGHRFKPIRFPDPEREGGPDLSRRFKDIIKRMCAKTPNERYNTMGEVVDEFELYLKETHDVVDGPDEKQKQTLEWAAQEFAKSSWAKLRPTILVGFVIALLVAIAICAMTIPQPTIAFGASGGVLGFGVLTAVLGFVFVGMKRRDALFARARQFVLGAGFIEWILMLGGLALLGWVLWNVGWLWWWLAGGVLAAVVAAFYASVVDKGVESDRQPMVTRAERVLREMRQAGVDENEVRKAVAEAAGDQWEAFYESLFGYTQKLEARRTFGVDDRGKHRPRDGAWRDPILHWLDERLEGRRLKRDQKLMKALATNELIAKGVRKEAAERQAENQANREIGKGAMLRDQVREELRRELGQTLREEIAKELDRRQEEDDELRDERGNKIRRREVKYTDDDFERIQESYFKRRYGTIWDLLVGQQVRFVLAAVLLAAFALWFNQNQEEILMGTPTEEAEAAEDAPDDLQRSIDFRNRADTGNDNDTDTAEAPVDAGIDWYISRDRSVEIPGVSADITHWVSGWRAGLAGALLLLSSFFYGRWLGILSLTSAGIALAGPVIWHEGLNLSPELGWIPLAAAAALGAIAVFFMRQDLD